MPSAAERRLFCGTAVAVLVLDLVTKLAGRGVPAADHRRVGDRATGSSSAWSTIPGPRSASISGRTPAGSSWLSRARGGRAHPDVRARRCRATGSASWRSGWWRAAPLGNLVDRIRSPRGVVDFLDVGVGTLRWPTFNVADIAVSCGAVALAISLWLEDSRQAAARSRDRPAEAGLRATVATLHVPGGRAPSGSTASSPTSCSFPGPRPRAWSRPTACHGQRRGGARLPPAQSAGMRSIVDPAGDRAAAPAPARRHPPHRRLRGRAPRRHRQARGPRGAPGPGPLGRHPRQRAGGAGHHAAGGAPGARGSSTGSTGTPRASWWWPRPTWRTAGWRRARARKVRRRVRGAGLGPPRREPARSSRRRSRGTRTTASGWRSATGRPARTDAWSSPGSRSADLLRLELQPGGPTRSGSTWRTSATRSSGTRSMVPGAAGGSRARRGCAEASSGAAPAGAPRRPLAFRHPVTARPLEFRSEWPADLRDALELAAGSILCCSHRGSSLSSFL